MEAGKRIQLPVHGQATYSHMCIRTSVSFQTTLHALRLDQMCISCECLHMEVAGIVAGSARSATVW